ncbi:MAG: cobalamin-binding protein [Candidatus Omnitrophica bacterium]|nr:cobalamin-binding protein [Candidatus Omnitrophota bacterium]
MGLYQVKRTFHIIFCCIAGISFLAQTSHAQEQNLRIISLAPATTEILYSLGLEAQIVGVSTFCNYPPQVKEKAKVGSFSQPNIEMILYLQPDIIFCTGLEQARAVVQLRHLGLRVHVSDPKNLQELLESVIKIGDITGKKPQASELVQHMRENIEQLNILTKDIPVEKRPRVFLEIWHDPLMTAGKGSFVDVMITAAGGVNIAHETPRPYSYFNAEEVLYRNPQCLILTYMSRQKPLERMRKRLGWNAVDAVRDGRIYNDIDPNLILRAGPRIVEGLQELYKRFYPYT